MSGTAERRIAAALRSGAAFLVAEQQADGSFASLTSSSPTDFTKATPLPAIFVTSTMLAALHAVKDDQIKGIQKQAAAFLLAQKSTDWSFNYWQRDSDQSRTQPYPDDLDDTFCTLAALWLHDPVVVDGGALAAVAHLLFATEKRPGGPYRTWLLQTKTGERWGDIDLAVNANIGYFLSLQDVQVPGIVKLVEQAIRQNKYTSPYYPHPAMALYFIARWYRGKLTTQLTAATMTQLASTDSEPLLNTALLMSSLVRLGANSADLSATAERLLQAQQPDGSWPAAAFCLDPAQNGTPYYAGSSALTTALCLEALSLYTQVAIAVKTASATNTYQQLVDTANQQIATIAQPDLRRSTKEAVRRVLHGGNQQQIILLAQTAAKAAAIQAPADTLQQLSLANLWGWAAYTVCDDFLDNEGRPQLLPGAVFCLRRLHHTLSVTMPKNTAFHQELQTILDRTDAANAWELAHCRGQLKEGRFSIKQLPRYGNYWQLADRSLGHTIAALGALYAGGIASDAPQLQALRSFFHHYLIARQLNDDAHDWEEDLQHGHVNAAGVLVLQDWLEHTGNSLASGIPLDAAREALQSSMWEHVIDKVCKRIDRHVKAARQAIALPELFDVTPFEAMLHPVEQAAQTALASRRQTIDFLAKL